MAERPAPDPFEALRAPAVPIDPDTAFATRLRARIERALSLPEGVDVTVTGLEALNPPDDAAPVPAARTVLTPYLAVAGARRALDWYAEAFGARLRAQPVAMPDGRIGHAELEVGGAVLMLADEYPEVGHTAPRPGAGPSVTLHAQVDDVDAMVDRAVEAGATLDRPPEDHPYGRNALVVDPFGHRWLVSGPVSGRDEVPAAGARRFPNGTRHGDVGYISFKVPDLDRAEAFYRRVLGWELAPAERPEARRVLDVTPLTSLWGFQDRGTQVVCWRVDDVAVAVARVRARGGEATDPVRLDYGTTADCIDDQGMPFYLWQPTEADAAATAGVVDRPVNGSRQGDLAYLTLEVIDSGRFRAFFGDVLGMQLTPGRSEDGWEVVGTMPMTGVVGGAGQASGVPMFRVDDIEAAVERVRASGGTATPVERMPYGLTSVCTDDQGTRFWLGQL